MDRSLLREWSSITKSAGVKGTQGLQEDSAKDAEKLLNDTIESPKSVDFHVGAS